MSCRLEIKKSVEKSINTKLPYRDAIYPLASAKIIANYLNKLWDSKIAVPIQHLKQGMYKVSILSLDEAIDKEFAKQEKSQKSFEHNLDFFIDDHILYQQNLAEDKLNTIAPPKQTPNVKQGTLFQKQTQSQEGLIASEKTIRDLAARMSDRIGIPIKFISDRSLDWKGRIINNIAEINLAYATLDTPIHEILGHLIIRAIRNRQSKDGSIEEVNTFMADYWDAHPEKSREEVEKYVDKNFKPTIISSQLYQNLLKELETGRGKEVLDRIKRDYQYKEGRNPYKKVKSRDITEDFILKNREGFKTFFLDSNQIYEQSNGKWRVFVNNKGDIKRDLSAKELSQFIYDNSTPFDTLDVFDNSIGKYTVEEQQEEAIVELLGLMTAEKLDNVKDGKLISLLKRLLKEMKAFMKQLLNQKEVEIDKLPDNMTLGDLSDLLAYSNSKLILPGYQVTYTTPDNNTFKTYQEASNHISELAKSVKDVNLDNIKLQLDEIPERFESPTQGEFEGWRVMKDKDGKWWEWIEGEQPEVITEEKAKKLWESLSGFEIFGVKNKLITEKSLHDFIHKNKEYEQSKEIIEEWKKVNSIQYNLEEIYSRGQEFSSVVGAYSDFDVNLMMQNLLQHIEDNEKAGSQFAISAYTKPVDKQIGHLEGGGGKIKFKIYPQSNDILWAANTDVYSGSVWDASEKVNKDKKSELLGVSYTKYPSLTNVNTVQPNLASIVDNLAHHHNELGIVLTGNNFRLEYDEDIPYQTKKIIDGINSVLDQKYGKLIKPEIKIKNIKTYYTIERVSGYYDTDFSGEYSEVEVKNKIEQLEQKFKGNKYIAKLNTKSGIQPTQTNETLKESINSVKEKLNENNLQDEDMPFAPKEQRKEYTSQALINTKIAALKEVAKKYPRSLIRSEVVRTKEYYPGEFSGFAEDELPFQKVSKKSQEKINLNSYQEYLQSSKESVSLEEDYFNSLPDKIKKIIIDRNKNC
jgi:hypothetical protein